MLNFQKTINENQNIEDGLKRIVKESFQTLYSTLGKNNFTRWIDSAELDDKLKTLIVNSMTEAEEIKYSNWAGFYNFNNNRIAIGNDYKNSIGTVTHELDHMLSGKNRFCSYINEGLTEYIKKIASLAFSSDNQYENHDTYIENTKTVAWMHKVLGDSLIKAYFIGRGQKYDRDLAEIMGCEPLDVIKFYMALERRHEVLHSGVSKDDKSVFGGDLSYEKDEKFISEMFGKMVLGKIREAAKNLEFYSKDGKINTQMVYQLLEGFPFNSDKNFMMKLEQEAFGVIVEESHLLVDYNGEEKASKKVEFIAALKKGDLKIIEKENSELGAKIFQKVFSDDLNIDINQFTDKVLSIVSTIDMTDREREALISQYAIKTLGKDVDLRVIDEYIKANMNRNQNLQKIVSDRKRNVVDSKFVRIGDVSSNLFLEKRDNRYYVVQIDDNGEMIEVPADKSSYLGITYGKNSAGKVVIGVAEAGKNKISVNKNQIELSDKLENVVINGEKVEDMEIIASAKEFVEYQRILPLIKEIKSQKYGNRINNEQDPFYGVNGVRFVGPGNIDPRGIEIDFDYLSSSLSKIDILEKDEKRVEALKKEVVRDIIRGTYGLPEEDSKYLAAYEILEKVALGEFSEDEKKSRLADAYGILHQGIRETATENMKYSLISFDNDETKKEYFKRVELEKSQQEKREKTKKSIEAVKRKEAEKKKFEEDKKRVSRTAYYEAIVDDEDKTRFEAQNGFGISDRYFVGGKIDGPGKRKILIDKFVQDVTSVTSRMEKVEEIEAFVETCARTTITSAYQVSKDEIKDPVLQEQYDFMIQSLMDRTLRGTEIDEEQFEYANEALNQNRKQLKTPKLLGFRTEQAKNLYESLIELQEKLDKGSFDKVVESIVTNFNRGQGEKSDERADQK